MDIYKSLLDHSGIIFPFIGELGWEIMRFSGIIRNIKKHYPEKHIVVGSRLDRYDLYHKYIDDFIPIIIPHEDKYLANCYRLQGQPKDEYNDIIEAIREKYPNHYVFNPTIFSCQRNVFRFSDMDFNFTPRKENSQYINKFMKSDKPCIVISSRHREDIPVRNWGSGRWSELFKLIEKNDKFLVFMVGKYPTYIRPHPSYQNFICVENLCDEYTSIIGLTIEAIRSSVLTIASQTAAPLLSQLLGTPTLVWGHEKKRHSLEENLKNTPCLFIEDKTYSLSPQKIFDYILYLSGQI